MNELAAFIRPGLMLSVGCALIVAGVAAWFRYARSLRANPKKAMAGDLILSASVSPWSTAPALGVLSVCVGCFLMFFGGLLFVAALQVQP